MNSRDSKIGDRLRVLPLAIPGLSSGRQIPKQSPHPAKKSPFLRHNLLVRPLAISQFSDARTQMLSTPSVPSGSHRRAIQWVSCGIAITSARVAASLG